MLPFLVVAAACGWAYWSKTDKGPSEPFVWLIISVVMMAILFWVLRKDLWRMADTVEDRGNSLVVTRWRTQATIPLSMIR